MHIKLAIYLKLSEVKRSELKQRFNKFKQLLAINLVNELVKVCPVDTGQLRQSIDWRITGKTIEIFMKDYAFYVEFGTPPHIIRPKNAKALHWKVKGKDVFAKVVHHPGTQPQPFIRNTLRTKFKDLCRISAQGAFT